VALRGREGETGRRTRRKPKKKASCLGWNGDKGQRLQGMKGRLAKEKGKATAGRGKISRLLLRLETQKKRRPFLELTRQKKKKRAFYASARDLRPRLLLEPRRKAECHPRPSGEREEKIPSLLYRKKKTGAVLSSAGTGTRGQSNPRRSKKKIFLRGSSEKSFSSPRKKNLFKCTATKGRRRRLRFLLIMLQGEKAALH